MHARRTAYHLRTGLTPDVARGPTMERRAHGLLRPAGLDTVAHVQRVDDAVGLLLPGTALGGWASLFLQGNDWFDGWSGDGVRPALVHCSPGTQLRRRDVITPFRGRILAEELTTVDVGERVAATTLARAAFDEARTAPDLRAAVVAIDMAVSTTHRRPRTTLEAVRRVEARHVKVRGVVQVRRALDLASERSASPAETRTRLVAQLDAGLTGLRVNAPLFDLDGALLGVADLVDPETGLVIETDGAGHREIEQHTLDNRREEAFERAGCVVVRATALDHRDRWGLSARIVRGRLDADRTSRRRWTLEPPRWWSTWPGARPWL